MASHDWQRPFWLQPESDPTCVYGLGVELDAGALVTWLDQSTGRIRFAGFLSAADALLQLQRQFGRRVPLIIVWDDRPIEPDVPFMEEEIVLTKAKQSDGEKFGS
jgi:hypothetical protein